MTYDEALAARVRAALDAAAGPGDYREIKMFGGLCWTVNTHMAVGTGEADLMVHVGSAGVGEALEHGARPARMGERTMGGVVLVAAADLPDREALDAWVRPAVERARARPGPRSGPRSGRRREPRGAPSHRVRRLTARRCRWLWHPGPRAMSSRALGAVQLRTGGDSPRPGRLQRPVDQVELLDRRSKSG